MEITLKERMESLKAGGIAGMAFLVAYGSFSLVNHNFGIASQETLIKLAIALLSGFLFGVTYRYIVRSDRNPHLNSGAVAAFGLVRGLAQVDTGLHLQSHNLWWFVAIAMESILLFAIARFVLDIAISWGWIEAFQSPPQKSAINSSKTD
jgi:hypothetical protein